MVSTQGRVGGNGCGQPGRLFQPSQVLKNLLFLGGREAEAPLLGWWSGMGKASKDRAFGAGGKGFGWPGWPFSSSPGAVPGSRQTNTSLTPMLLAAIYVYIYIVIFLRLTRVFFQADVLGCGWRLELQRRVIFSHSLPASHPKVLLFFLQTPKSRCREPVGFRGVSRAGCGRGVPRCLPPSLGPPSRLPSLLAPHPSLSPLSLAHAFLPPGFLLHSCLLLSFFFAILPVSIALPPLPLFPSLTTLSAPPTPTYKLRNQNFQDLPLLNQSYYFFFPVLWPESWNTLLAGPLTCSEGYWRCVLEQSGGERGGMSLSLFPRLSPQGWLSQADAPMPRERGSEAGGEGTWEGGGRAATPPSQSSPRQATRENEIYSNYPGQKTSGTSLLLPSSFPLPQCHFPSFGISCLPLLATHYNGLEGKGKPQLLANLVRGAWPGGQRKGFCPFYMCDPSGITTRLSHPVLNGKPPVPVV